MNETIPPLPGNAPQSKNSALAIWSLVLGILSLTCFSIFSAIPGVICGHKALSKIKQSGGALTGQGLAIGGSGDGLSGNIVGLDFYSHDAGHCDSQFRQGTRRINAECVYQQPAPD